MVQEKSQEFLFGYSHVKRKMRYSVRSWKTEILKWMKRKQMVKHR